MISCEVNALTVLVLLSLFMRFLFSSETQFLSVLFLHRFFHSLITCSFCSLEFVMADFFFSWCFDGFWLCKIQFIHLSIHIYIYCFWTFVFVKIIELHGTSNKC